MRTQKRIFFFSVLVLALSWVWVFRVRENSGPALGEHKTTSPTLVQNSHSSLKPVSVAPDEKIKLTSTSETTHKIEVLNEIFQTRNDNDPRLDSDFNHLTSTDKQALEQQYEKLRTELRNERGTIVFLIGRNLSTHQDFEFFQQVLNESPCLSMENCSAATPKEGPHEDYSTEVSLHYPQIVALKSIENYLSQNPNSSDALRILNEASKSKNLIISQMATSIHSHLAHPLL